MGFPAVYPSAYYELANSLTFGEREREVGAVRDNDGGKYLSDMLTLNYTFRAPYSYSPYGCHRFAKILFPWILLFATRERCLSDALFSPTMPSIFLFKEALPLLASDADTNMS